MKKTCWIALVLALGMAWASQAVVIHWATDGYGSLSYKDVGSAVLVYIAVGEAPVYASGTLSNGETLGTPVTGSPPITSGGIWEQSTTDETPRSEGAYYVVLFNDAGTQFAYSTDALAYNNTKWQAFSPDEMTPALGSFAPDAFSPWAPVPEPGSALLLAMGAAAIALRRRRRA